jgi:hypothetical protein
MEAVVASAGLPRLLVCYSLVTLTKPNIQSLRKCVRFMQMTRYRPVLRNRYVINSPLEVGPAGIVPPLRNCWPPADVRRPGSNHTRLSGCVSYVRIYSNDDVTMTIRHIVCRVGVRRVEIADVESRVGEMVLGSGPAQRNCPTSFRVVSLLTS